MDGDDGATVERLILGTSRAIVELRREIRAIARAPVRSVLVLGETGVGKDLVPRALLACSRNLSGRLEVFNCPAIPQDHLESELFGTTRGAYPGAVDRPGAAERAEAGLLFLDEISAMTLALKTNFMRFLDSGEGRRLGAAHSYRVRTSVVSATNDDLRLRVAEGLFREDLYYRLVQDAVIRVPPLRERLEDIAVLARAFLGELPVARELSAVAVERLRRHNWPGNVRELRAVVCSAARLAPHADVRGADVQAALDRIAAPVASRDATGSTPSPPSPASFYSATSDFRRKLLIDALAAAAGNQTLAGVLLGLHGAPRDGDLDLRARKLAHRKFNYWWGRLVDAREKGANGKAG